MSQPVSQSGLEDELDEALGIVMTSVRGEPYTKETLFKIKEKLEDEARRINADYIFGVKFKVDKSGYTQNNITMAYGDAYRKR